MDCSVASRTRRRERTNLAVALARRRTTRVPRVAGAAALLALVTLALACAPASDAARYAARRKALVNAIEAGGVRDAATLAALRAVPRHEFVPADLRALAYVDEPLPIGHEQTISQPTIVAIMTEALRPRRGLRVLEIGTGSGYQAAVLAQAGCRVYTIEIIAALADSARERLRRLGYDSVEVRHGDGWLGWPEAAPFEAILLTAAPDVVPRALLDQLAPGGRMVLPLGPEAGVQQLQLLEKDSLGAVRTTAMAPVRFVPMRGRGAR